MAKIKKAQTGIKAKLLPSTRVREISDSLNKEADRKRTNAFYATQDKNLSQKDWESINGYYHREADKDESNAKRYKSLADKAEKEKRTKFTSVGKAAAKAAVLRKGGNVKKSKNTVKVNKSSSKMRTSKSKK